MTHFAETTVRVRYAETDQMGVAYHANYLVWFEVGRVELMRSLGLEYRRLEAEYGLLITVVEACVRYKQPARYDDLLRVKTGISALRGSLLRMEYALTRAADDVLLCTGATAHMVVDRTMRRQVLPDSYERAFRTLLNGSNQIQS